MKKVTIVKPFRDKDAFYTAYKPGEVKGFDDDRVAALTARGLVEVLDETTEEKAPKKPAAPKGEKGDKSKKGGKSKGNGAQTDKAENGTDAEANADGDAGAEVEAEPGNDTEKPIED